MFPMKGMNPKQMQKMMRQMGVKVKELKGVTKVVIYREKENIVITNPQVTKTKVMGQEMYQVVGDEKAAPAQETETEPQQPAVSDEDVELVASQANVSQDKARKALQESEGDIAEAIIALTE